MYIIQSPLGGNDWKHEVWQERSPGTRSSHSCKLEGSGEDGEKWLDSK